MAITPQDQLQAQTISTFQRDGDSAFAGHCSHMVDINRSPEQVFALADEHALLSSHMARRTWMTGGGRMNIHSDSGAGRQLAPEFN